MHEECLICGAPLKYLNADEPMTCALCGKTESSKTRCEKGHYVCSDCHMAGLDQMIGICLQAESADPIAILEQMMSLPQCHMHGPEHHVMVGAALLTAYRNAGGKLELPGALKEMLRRGRQVPGGACGYWGACGAGLSTGMFVSIATGSTPLAKEAWGLSNRMTADALAAIGGHGGPRCCKRDSYLAVQAAVRFAAEHLGVRMEAGEIRCTRCRMNNQCLGGACPFHPSAG